MLKDKSMTVDRMAPNYLTYLSEEVATEHITMRESCASERFHTMTSVVLE